MNLRVSPQTEQMTKTLQDHKNHVLKMFLIWKNVHDTAISKKETEKNREPIRVRSQALEQTKVCMDMCILKIYTKKRLNKYRPKYFW